MIDEPVLDLVKRCIRRRELVKSIEEMRGPPFLVKMAHRNLSNAEAALRVQVDCGSKQDPLEYWAIQAIVIQAIKEMDIETEE